MYMSSLHIYEFKDKADCFVHTSFSLVKKKLVCICYTKRFKFVKSS